MGSLALLFRKGLAVPLFLASLVCMILTSIRNFAFSNGLEVMGGAANLIFSAVILVVGVLLLVYARSIRKRGMLS